MARQKKERYPTTPAQPPGSGLFAAFEGLSAEGLPPGQEPASGEEAAPPAKGTGPRRGRAILRKETAHRGGKTVLVIRFEPEPGREELDELAKRLRVACGCGGAVKEGEIELQGRQLEKVRELLARDGFRLAGITRLE